MLTRVQRRGERTCAYVHAPKFYACPSHAHTHRYTCANVNVNVQCRQRTHKPYTPTHARALRHVSLREHDAFERDRLRTLALGREGDADLGEEPLHCS